jgi:hypothetical protein
MHSSIFELLPDSIEVTPVHLHFHLYCCFDTLELPDSVIECIAVSAQIPIRSTKSTTHIIETNVICFDLAKIASRD